MSVLETFYLLFKTDTSDLKKGASEVTNIVNKTATAFAGIVTTGAFIAKSLSALSYVQDLQQVSRALQVNISDLDAWGNAVSRSGGSAQAFQGSLRSLAERFNISGNQALKLLPRLADSFAKLNPTQALKYGKNLGLDESTILLLQHGRREVEAVIQRQKELGTVNAQDADIVKKFNESLHDVNVATRVFFMELLSPALPYFTKGLQYLIDHKNLVIGALLGIASAALILMTPFSWIGVLVTAARIGIGLLIALFALIFEDINAYMHGQNSLIGDLEKRWPKVAAVIRAAFKWVSWEINAILHPLQTLQDILDYIVDKIKSIFGSKKELTINFNENTKKLIGAGANDTNSTIARFNALGLPTPVSKSNTVNVTGPITVNTQATDANGITQDMGKSLNNQLAQVNNHVDDGVMY